MSADELFEGVVGALEGEPDVSAGRMFGSPGLKIDGKAFAMLVKGRLVVKLPQERVDEIQSSGAGERFDPGHGRLMREWAAVHPSTPEAWLELATEARDFVRPL